MYKETVYIRTGNKSISFRETNKFSWKFSINTTLMGEGYVRVWPTGVVIPNTGVPV